MKLRKAIKAAIAGAAVAPVVAMAGSPIGFGGWTATTTGVNVTCPSGFTCTAGTTEGTTGEQFLQRQITDGAGNTYIQTVVTGDTGQVSDESFVKIGGSGGIADQAKINSTEGGTNFDSTANILTGDFFTGTDHGLDFTQNLSNSNTASTFTAGFHYQEQDAAATVAGFTSGLRAETTVKGFVSDAEGMDATFTMTEIEVIETSAAESTAAAAQYSKGLYVANNVDDTALSTEPLVQNFLIREAEGPLMVTGTTTLSGTLNGGNSFTVAAGGAFEAMQMTQTVAGSSYATEQFFNVSGGTGSVDTDNFGGEVAGITITPDPF